MSSRSLFRWFGARRAKSFRRQSRPSLVVEALEPRWVPAIFTVINTDDSGVGSLRQAMLEADNSPNVGGPDEIHFDIPGDGVHQIFLAAVPGPFGLPVIHDPVIIDGYTQPG